MNYWTRDEIQTLRRLREGFTQVVVGLCVTLDGHDWEDLGAHDHLTLQFLWAKVS